MTIICSDWVELPTIQLKVLPLFCKAYTPYNKKYHLRWRSPTQSGKIYGYARVPSERQNEEHQLITPRVFGIRGRDIYCDRQSGEGSDRPNYQRLLLRLQAGDVFVVKSIDRLGRNYSEILYQRRLLIKEKQAFIVVPDMSLLDTRSTRDLTGTLITGIVL